MNVCNKTGIIRQSNPFVTLTGEFFHHDFVSLIPGSLISITYTLLYLKMTGTILGLLLEMSRL